MRAVRKEIGMMRQRLSSLLMSLLLLCLPVGGLASGRWVDVATEEQTADAGFLVCEYTGPVTISFLGDCTLGGEEKSRNAALGYAHYIAENGFDFPFQNLIRLTGTDDLTIANLEGVLTDRRLPKREKEYNFSGPTDYTRILQEGSIECVTLANNHILDYGEEGYQDTVSALKEAGITWFDTENLAIWENEDGLRIGFVGAYWNLSGSRSTLHAAQVQRLRELGCAAVITFMHAGDEYVYTPSATQRAIASRAAAQGADLVIGAHPHVVQGIDRIGHTPVVYSLGNCSFGGTTHAKDSDALLAQAELHFDAGLLTGITLHLYPISITSDARYNNYSPAFLTGRDAERVIQKMEKSTGFALGDFDEKAGVTVYFGADD